MRKIFKGINILLSVVLIFIAAGVAFIAFPQFGNKALIVRSGSMAPTIEVGSIVVARPIDIGTYSKRDIIAFRSEKNPETLITHRVVEVESGPDGVSYKTKGDANEEADGWSVDSKNILGKVQLTLPYLGRILTFAKSDIGFPTLIIFPAIIVIILEAWTIIKEIRKRKRENAFGFDRFDKLKSRKYNLTGFKVLIPIFIFALSVPTALAFLNDVEISTDNIFQAANVFPSPSPLPTPSITPTPTIEPSISPEPTP